jgi:hypothetical protein
MAWLFMNDTVVHDRKKLVEAASEDAARRDMPVAVGRMHLFRGERILSARTNVTSVRTRSCRERVTLFFTYSNNRQNF